MRRNRKTNRQAVDLPEVEITLLGFFPLKMWEQSGDSIAAMYAKFPIMSTHADMGSEDTHRREWKSV